MGSHDPCGNLAGAGLFGLTGAARLGGVITACALVAAGELVVAVGAQRHPIGAGMPRAARVEELFGCQPFGGAPLRALVLTPGNTVLVSIGVAPRPIQRLLPGPGLLSRPRRGVLLLNGAADPLGDQPPGCIAGKRRDRQVRDVRIHPGTPAGGNRTAASPGGRRLIPALMTSRCA
jgi:hypothetical protein